MKKLILLLIFMQLGVVSMAQDLYKNMNAPIHERIQDLLSKLTIEEKISLLRATSPGIERMGIDKYYMGNEALHGIIRPGKFTVFPQAIGLASMWNPELHHIIASVISDEARARWNELERGKKQKDQFSDLLTFWSPTVNMARDPRWGRMAEGCGEDTYLTTVMGVAMVKGFQGDSLNSPTSIASCPKHFVGYGAAEGGRDYNSTFIPERRLRNVYLPPFEAASKAGAATFMTSFNDNDGVPSTGNSFILKDVLRSEWGFDGLVVTDWASSTEMIAHGFAADSKEVAMKAVNAGVDMEMVGNTFVKELPGLIKEGKVKEAEIDNAVRNILRIKYRLGLFENPYVDEKANVLYAPSHLEAAKQAATESAILLKNDHETLPLQSSVKTIAIVGPMANAPYDQLGTWVFDGEKSHTVTPLTAIKELADDKVQIIYEPGLTYSRDKNIAGVAKAAAAAARADVILAFVGEEAILSGEAHCLADLNLQGAQSELISALAKTGKPVVTIVMAGRPLTIGKETELSSALLYSFHPGTMGGPALADLLFGKAVPSGKTPVTFPKMVGQVPVYYAHNNTGRPATRSEVLIDDIALEAGQTSLGCTSFYMDAGFDPLFPFGYGLSYTTFQYGNVKLSSDNLKKDDVLTVTFDLENTGKYEGTEVAQLYVQDMIGSVTRPVKELKRFTRVTLKPGEKKTVSFELPISELAFWNIDMVKTVEPGDFALWVAPDSQSGEKNLFKVVD